MILAIKMICLFLGLAFAVPVIIGGAIQGHRVSQGQVFLFAGGLVGFVALQWLV